MGFLDSRIIKPNSFITLQTSQDLFDNIKYNYSRADIVIDGEPVFTDFEDILWEKPENVYWMPLIIPNIKNFYLGVPDPDYDKYKYLKSPYQVSLSLSGHIFPFEQFGWQSPQISFDKLNDPINNYEYFKHIKPINGIDTEKTQNLINSIFYEYRNMINLNNYDIVISRSQEPYLEKPKSDRAWDYRYQYYEIFKNSIPIFSSKLYDNWYNYYNIETTLKNITNLNEDNKFLDGSTSYYTDSNNVKHKLYLTYNYYTNDIKDNKLPINTSNYIKSYIPLEPQYIYFYYLRYKQPSLNSNDKEKYYIPTADSMGLHRIEMWQKDSNNCNILGKDDYYNAYDSKYVEGLKTINGASRAYYNWKYFYTNYNGEIKLQTKQFYNNYSNNDFNVVRTKDPSNWDSYYYNYNNSNARSDRQRDLIRINNFNTYKNNQCFLYLNLEIKGPIITAHFSHINNGSNNITSSNNFIDLDGNLPPFFQKVQELKRQVTGQLNSGEERYCEYEEQRSV